MTFILAACQSTDHSQKKQTSVIKHQPKTTANKSITQKLYLGYWTIKGEENATMQIGKDSIFYTDNFTSYKYNIISDSIKIQFDGFTGTYLLKMRGKDTLYWNDKEDGESAFYRFKK